MLVSNRVNQLIGDILSQKDMMIVSPQKIPSFGNYNSNMCRLAVKESKRVDWTNRYATFCDHLKKIETNNFTGKPR